MIVPMKNEAGDLLPLAYVTKVISLNDPQYKGSEGLLKAVQADKDNIIGKEVLSLEDGAVRSWFEVAKEDPTAVYVRLHTIAGVKNTETPGSEQFKVRVVANGGYARDVWNAPAPSLELYTLPIGQNTTRLVASHALT